MSNQLDVITCIMYNWWWLLIAEQTTSMHTAPLKTDMCRKTSVVWTWKLKVCHILWRHEKVWTFSIQVPCQRDENLYLLVEENAFIWFTCSFDLGVGEEPVELMSVYFSLVVLDMSFSCFSESPTLFYCHLLTLLLSNWGVYGEWL